MKQTQYEVIPLISLITGGLGVVLFGGAIILMLILNLNTILKLNYQSVIYIVIIVIFVPFLLLSLLVLLHCQKIIITDEGLSVIRLNRKYSLQYSEIKYCYINSGNINIGNNSKQISFPSFECWSGKSKQDAVILMIQSFNERKIEPQLSIKGLFPYIKGFDK